MSYSEELSFSFRKLPGVLPRSFLQKLLKCWAEEKLNSSIISEKGMYGIDRRYLMRSARFCINHWYTEIPNSVLNVLRKVCMP